VGVYPMSFAQYIYGGHRKKSPACNGLATPVWMRPSSPDALPGGGLAQIASSFRNPFNIQMEIIGRQGRLSLNRPFTALDDNRHLLFYPRTATCRRSRCLNRSCI